MTFPNLQKMILSVAIAAFVQGASASDPFAELDQATNRFGKQQERSMAQEFESFKQSRRAAYEDYKRVLLEEFAAYKKITEEETQKYTRAISEVWDQPELSSKTVWVEYTKSNSQKSRVDFENQQIEISVTVDKDKKKPDEKALKKALTELVKKDKAQAYNDDKLAQAIETRSKESITNLKTAEVPPAPIISGYLTGKEKPSDKDVTNIVEHMVKEQKVSEKTNSKGQKVVTITVPLAAPTPEPLPTPLPLPVPKVDKAKETPKTTVTPSEKVVVKDSALKQPKEMAATRRDKLPQKAQALSPYVSKYAAKAEIDDALVYAVIETESAFNPMARSGVPAYGLMQIVPSSAGQDATQDLFGEAKILSPSYLYNSEKNIEIGTTYLKILYYRYLKGIENPESRLYCAIAAYNTGAGNVAKAFTGKRRLSPALTIINKMTPEQVFEKLKEDLPYDETRKYLVKVTDRKPKYEI